MVIMKMSNVFVKHGRLLLGFLTILIIISFVWIMTPGAGGGGCGMNPGSSETVVAEAFGHKIKSIDVTKQMNELNILSMLQGGGAVNQENAIQGCLVNATAMHLGLRVSNEEVVNAIKNISFLRNSSNAFDQKMYDDFETNILAKNKYTKVDFEKAIRNNILREKVFNYFCLNMLMVTDSEAKEREISFYEKYQTRKITFTYNDFRLDKEYDDQELIHFYEANKVLFMKEPKVNVEIVAFLNKDYQVSANELTQEELENYYKFMENDFKDEDGKIKPLEAVIDQVRAKAIAEKTRLKANEAAKAFREKLYDISETAEFSVNPLKGFEETVASSGYKLIKANNIYLSTESIEGIGPEKNLILSLFQISEHYPIGNTVIGNNGSYIAFLKERVESNPEEFLEIRDKVLKAKQDSDMRASARENTANFVARLSESANPGAELEEIAGMFKGKVEQEEEFNLRNATPKDPENNIAKALAVGTQTGKLSQSSVALIGANIIKDKVFYIFVDNRIQPENRELAPGELEYNKYFLFNEKRQIAFDSFSEWIFNNSKRYDRTEQ